MTGEEFLKIYKPFFVEVCIKWVSAIMSPKMFVPEMSTVPKCLFPWCLLWQLARPGRCPCPFQQSPIPSMHRINLLPARDNLKTVWIWIKTVKTVGLIRIQTVCHSDGIPENSLEKIMTVVIMLTLYLLVTVCKLVVTRSGTSKWLCWVWSGSKLVWQSGIPEKFIRVTSIKGYDWSTII